MAKVINPETKRMVRVGGRAHQKMQRDRAVSRAKARQKAEDAQDMQGGLIVFENPTKSFHEKWEKGRGMLNFPHPFRAVLIGPPNSGKGSAVKNLVLHAKPEFERFIVIYVDPGDESEFEDIMEGVAEEDAMILGDIPPVEAWDKTKKTMVVLDDLDYDGLSREQQTNLGRLFGNASTHKNISVALTAQDPFNIPPGVRRCANLWVIWGMDDGDAVAALSRKLGMTKKRLQKMLARLPGFHDSLWIDRTFQSPYPLRVNGTRLFSEE